MKWGHGNFKFSRPIRWIISLYNNQILDFDVMDIEPNLTISKKTRGHRLFNNDIEIEEPSGYFAIMRNYGVISDRAERKEAILNLVNKASIDLNLHPDLNEGLLSELIDLVEKPNLILGTFDSKYLCLPAEVLCTVMKSHQRYIPFLKKGKRIDKLKITSEDILSTNFLCISNGLSTSEKIIRRGNEKVLKARFADAKFFIEADQEISCESRNKKLKDISYLKGLGNINERVQRISYISEILVRELKDRDIDLDTVLKASQFSKNDLCSEIVYEFPELQGLMGGKYLRKEGYSKDISLAVAEHYLPRFYKDDLPSTKYAAVISIADKLETLISIYVIGERPTGSSDPYALR